MEDNSLVDCQIPLLDGSEMEVLTISTKDCCIYEAPSEQRQVNVEAYTPQMVLIGPLHHAKKQEALQIQNEICTSAFDMENIKHRYKQYLKMEKVKQVYYRSFSERVGTDAMSTFRSYTITNEKTIRKNYAVSTWWINVQEFVDIIQLDAIFIMELMLRSRNPDKHQDDFVFKAPSHLERLRSDFILLENQLPYFLLEELWHSSSPMIVQATKFHSFRDVTFKFFEIGPLSEDVKFKHFTDLLRCARIKFLRISPQRGQIAGLHNVEKLQEAGVDFERLEGEGCGSINIRFDNNRLKMIPMMMCNETELELRNIMALEQCHYLSELYVCSYVYLLDLLIDTERDVDILAQKGIITIMGGDKVSVARMFNNLCTGIFCGSLYYVDVAEALIKHQENPWNRAKAYVRHNYFDNVWKSTATLAGVTLLFFSFIQTLCSIIQVMQGRSQKR